MACILLLGVTGCTIDNSTAGNEEGEIDRFSESGDEETVKEAALNETDEFEGEERHEVNSDLVPEPYDFASILKKTKENGIEYYKVATEKDMPLPLDEWAKVNIFTEQGNAIDAYVRFTQVIKDIDKVEEHINYYFDVMAIKEPFGMLMTDNEQCILLQYEIMIAEDAKLEENDRIPSMALDYPLQLYSTLDNGKFINSGIERSVCDISILGQDEIELGDTIQKEVICYIPKEYTAYGVEFVYMTAKRTTNIVYFKPEY